MSLKKYKLGELIELVLKTNSDLDYGADAVRGMTITKEIIPTKANVSTTDLSKFIVIEPNSFIYNPRTHGKKIGFGYNNTNKTFIISFNNMAFRVKSTMNDIVLSDYLFLHFRRDEWDREACYNSWGSSTEVFSWEALCDMQVLLPPIEIQQKYVDVYNALVENQKSYERGLDDLKLTCDAYIENLRKTIVNEEMGQYVIQIDERNTSMKHKNVKGLTVYKKFIDTKADMNGVSLSSYKIVKKGDIAYVPTTNRNGDRIACGLCNEECIISQIYEVLRVKKDSLLPEYLFMWFKRNEFDRWVRNNSWGSARETIEWEDMKSYKIPIPNLQMQKEVANIYNCFEMRVNINEKLKYQIKAICPILIKGSIEEGKKE